MVTLGKQGLRWPLDSGLGQTHAFLTCSSSCSRSRKEGDNLEDSPPLPHTPSALGHTAHSHSPPHKKQLCPAPPFTHQESHWAAAGAVIRSGNEGGCLEGGHAIQRNA
jgi:hypothetical protein